MGYRTRLALVLVFTANASCVETDRPSDGWAVTGVDEPRIVTNEAEGMWTPDDAWRAEEVLVLGGDVTGDVQFGDITGIEIDDEGTVYVADRLAQQILVFDADGSPVGSIGGPGQGPGELGGNVGGVFRIGGELVVPDVANQRVSHFGLDGAFHESFRVSADDGVPIRWDVGGGGRLVAQRRVVAPEDGTAAPADVVVSVSGAEAAPDTLRHLPPGQSVRITGGIPVVRPFDPEPVWDTTAEGRFVTAVTNARTFEMRGPDGRVEWVARLPGEAPAASASDREAVESSLRDMYQRQGVPPDIVESVIDRMELAERLPAFASVALGPRGSLWVQEVRRPLQAAGPGALVSATEMGGRDWTVLDEDGRLLGSVSFSIDFQPLTFVNDTFYGVGVDEFGTESVRAFRVMTQ